jgi:hypothetical protein
MFVLIATVVSPTPLPSPLGSPTLPYDPTTVAVVGAVVLAVGLPALVGFLGWLERRRPRR